MRIWAYANNVKKRSVLWQQTYSKYRRTADEFRCPVQPSTRFTPSLLSSQRSYAGSELPRRIFRRK